MDAGLNDATRRSTRRDSRRLRNDGTTVASDNGNNRDLSAMSAGCFRQVRGARIVAALCVFGKRVLGAVESGSLVDDPVVQTQLWTGLYWFFVIEYLLVHFVPVVVVGLYNDCLFTYKYHFPFVRTATDFFIYGPHGFLHLLLMFCVIQFVFIAGDYNFVVDNILFRVYVCNDLLFTVMVNDSESRLPVWKRLGLLLFGSVLIAPVTEATLIAAARSSCYYIGTNVFSTTLSCAVVFMPSILMFVWMCLLLKNR